MEGGQRASLPLLDGAPVLGVPTAGVARIATLPALLRPARLQLGARACRREPLAAVLGWGNKPSAARAARLAQRRGVPLWRCEDGFLRSLGLGADGPPLSLVLDDLGIYYDASRPSRLEGLIAAPLAPAQQQRAEALRQLWCQERLSKYNGGPESPAPAEPFVLVVDQTAGDLSIGGGLADGARFQEMLRCALAEHPHHTVVVKTHPEVARGRRRGHFTPADLADPRLRLCADGGHPAALLERAEAVYVVTSQLGFEALLWGRPVHCFGMPFYAGWGLTHDALPPPQRRAEAPSRALTDLVHAALIDYAVYVDPHRHQPCAVEDLVRCIGLQRRRLAASPGRALAVGFERWKRPVLARFLPGTRLRFARSEAAAGGAEEPAGQALVRWGYRAPALAKRWPGPVLQVEDGFLRSVGLGGDLHRPLSWVVDHRGVYYDATRPSDLEAWLASAELTAAQLARAAALRQRLVREAITKYNLNAKAWQRPPGLRRVVVVPGQVEGDASLRFGAVDIRTNLELLQAVRRAEPEAFLIYKPHPDVVAGLRRASAAERQALELADLVLPDVAMQALFDQVDAVHVLTSLAGFEALLRGLEVQVWGLPFYAGWGLTQDAHRCPRRGRQLSLDALVYGALIAYPRYVSRFSGWQISPEQAIDELLAWRQEHRPRLAWRTALIRLWARLRRRA
ncbi:MAG: capsular polysaccharide biosynthesis protein [Synechococcaceae cyanobacterium]|nr:capsular polysaccharide biosynthesis protein [Synechococcaceae cyanobacterium]